jgi:hypothetical protein
MDARDDNENLGEILSHVGDGFPTDGSKYRVKYSSWQHVPHLVKYAKIGLSCLSTLIIILKRKRIKGVFLSVLERLHKLVKSLFSKLMESITIKRLIPGSKFTKEIGLLLLVAILGLCVGLLIERRITPVFKRFLKALGEFLLLHSRAGNSMGELFGVFCGPCGDIVIAPVMAVL